MTSRSAGVAAERPFYDRHADAYDLLITDPVAPWVTAVDDELRAVGLDEALLVDAGCGTGRHAAALIDRGHDLVLLDASAALLKIARTRCPAAPALVSDLCSPALRGPVDGVLARGVLNDLVTDRERALAIGAFARLTRAGGVLLLDVREATTSQARATGVWRTIDAHLTEGCRLRFASRSTWSNGHILVDERYELAQVDGEMLDVSEYRFEMRPGSRGEMRRLLTDAGYERIEIRPGVGRRTPDRLFVTAHRSRTGTVRLGSR